MVDCPPGFYCPE